MEPKQELQTEASQSHNPSLFKTGDCRICFAGKKASEDPVIQLGCLCKDDMSYGHKSCLKKWFRRRFLRGEILNCELCRSPLGAHLEVIVRSASPAQVRVPPRVPGVPQLMLLVRIPASDLDDLEVPVETPDFSGLPAVTRLAIQDAFHREEQVQQSGETRRRENFMEAQRLAENGEGPLRREPPHWRFEWVEYQIRNEFIEMKDVTLFRWKLLSDRREPPNRAFVPYDVAEALYGDMEHGSMEPRHTDYTEILEGKVIRVAIEPELPPAAQHQIVDELLDELSTHLDLYVPEFHESNILLPTSMFLKDTPLLDAVPINNAAQQAPARREFTYGRFQRFLLSDRI